MVTIIIKYSDSGNLTLKFKSPLNTGKSFERLSYPVTINAELISNTNSSQTVANIVQTRKRHFTKTKRNTPENRLKFCSESFYPYVLSCKVKPFTQTVCDKPSLNFW